MENSGQNLTEKGQISFSNMDFTRAAKWPAVGNEKLCSGTAKIRALSHHKMDKRVLSEDQRASVGLPVSRPYSWGRVAPGRKSPRSKELPGRGLENSTIQVDIRSKNTRHLKNRHVCDIVDFKGELPTLRCDCKKNGAQKITRQFAFRKVDLAGCRTSPSNQRISSCF